MRRLPPLDALRAFEAAARHLSFTKAGDELCVTPSAISHRVRALEDELGILLFRRLTRQLALTREGEILAAGLRRGLDDILQALEAIDNETAGPLTISTLPSFAARWLVPRLAGFQDRHPDVEVQIVADQRLADLVSDGTDLAVRFGRGAYPGLRSLLLMGEAVVPVCSPRLIKRAGPVQSPADLVRLPLLHDSTAEGDGSGASWPNWFAHAGAPDQPCTRGQRFSQALLAIEAAKAGLGVALARVSLLGDDVASGRLVQVLPKAAPTAFSYYVVCRPERAVESRILLFCKWLHEEAAVHARQSGISHGLSHG